MGNRLLMVMVAAVAIVAVGGIGFAAWTSTVTVSGSGSAGTVNLEWCIANANPTGTCTSGNSPSSTGSGGCTQSATASTLTITADNLGPSESCTFTDTLLNTGSLPAYVTESGTNGYGFYPGGGGFSYGGVTYADSGWDGSSTSSYIVAGGSATYTGTISLSDISDYTGTIAFTVTITGSAY
jgi:hypothetical protein